MSHIEIRHEDILLKGTTFEPWGKYKFIVYINENDSRQKIRVNTNYYEIGKGVYCCSSNYDRGLCDTIEELRKFPIERIEIQAYGSYMDGAR